MTGQVLLDDDGGGKIARQIPQHGGQRLQAARRRHQRHQLDSGPIRLSRHPFSLHPSAHFRRRWP